MRGGFRYVRDVACTTPILCICVMAANSPSAHNPMGRAALPQHPPSQAAQPAAQVAQPAAQVAQQTAEQVERVEITGSRIPQGNVAGPSPVTTLNAQDIKFDGHAQAQAFLNHVPPLYTRQGAARSKPA